MVLIAEFDVIETLSMLDHVVCLFCLLVLIILSACLLTLFFITVLDWSQLDFHPQHKQVASGSDDETVRLWDLAGRV